jgi:nucleoside-diphosphate-sugar epimerase
MKRILITGAAGFIGFHLAEKLSAESGNELVLADNFVRGREDADFQALLKKQNVTPIRADLTESASFQLLGGDFDEVYHLAAIIGVNNVMERPYDVVRVNGLATLNLLDWLRAGGGRKVLFSSTSEAYAWTQQFYKLPIPTPEDVPLALTELPNPRSSYAGSKIFGELAVTHACSSIGKAFTIVRYHNVYGPRMGFDHVIPQLYQRVCSGESPLVVYSADHSRAFCYVGDAIDATIAAMQNSAADGQTFNVGNENEVTIADLARRILKLTGKNTPLEPQLAIHDPIVRRCPNMSKARQLLKFTAETTLDEGLTKTLEWYQRYWSAQV